MTYCDPSVLAPYCTATYCEACSKAKYENERKNDGTINKASLCGHSRYISHEAFKARNKNMNTHFLMPELRVRICRDCGKNIEKLNLFRTPKL